MLRVRLLGGLEAEVGDRPVPAPTSRRAWELLAWLALHPGPHHRQAVAARFWPDVLDASARASLRSAIWSLRGALGPDGAPALGATRDTLELRCTTDLQELDALLARGDLDAAVSLGAVPLLDGIEEEWVLEARDRHAERLAAVLARLADAAPTPSAAIALARRRLALDPLDEAAARDLMSRLASTGERAPALRVHRRLEERLRTQLHIAPAAETQQLATRLRAPVARGSPAATAPPFVGRERELVALGGALDGPAGTLALITGEVGSGKTRLVAELAGRARARGVCVAGCAAPAAGPPPAFALWAELVGGLADTMCPPPADATWPAELAALTPAFAPRAAAPAPPDLAGARLAEAVVAALGHACADSPVLLVIDDAERADGQSLVLLGQVARRLAARSVLLVLTRRPAPARPELDALVHAHRGGGRLLLLELGPLDRGALRRLVHDVGALRPGVLEAVVAAAGGNPLLALEGAHGAAGGHPGASPALKALARAALGSLPPGPRRAAELVAVAGRGLGVDELARLAALEDAVAALDCGLLSPEPDALTYRHALLADAVRAQLPGVRRRVREEELGAALGGPPLPAGDLPRRQLACFPPGGGPRTRC